MMFDVIRYGAESSVGWGALAGPAPTSPLDQVDFRPFEDEATTTAALIACIEAGASPIEEIRGIRANTLLSPVTSDAQIICQGLNYLDHVAEAGHAHRRDNLFFLKAGSSLTGAYDDIIRPDGVELLDYEVEVGIVLRRDISQSTIIDEDNIGDYVAGVTLCNDVSARDIMFGAGFFQWFRGKSFRRFCPTGPVLRLITKDAVAPALAALSISLDLNGERRQSASTSHFIHKPSATLRELSELMDLRAGDLILTGTPGGVIAQASPAIVAILREQLVDDTARRTQLVAQFQQQSRFLEPGDLLTLRMRDDHAGVDMGGQLSRIV